MNLKIYQINIKRDKNCVKFLHYDHLDSFQETKDINASIYDEVFSGMVDCENLEDIYHKFNTEGHPLHRGHSLSVSDIVVTDDGAYYCDSIGFQKINFDESQANKTDDLMRVVYVEPNKAPYVTEIKDELSALQKAVGGYIEVVGNGDGTLIICNEEGKLKGLEGNRRIHDGASVISGTFFVVGEDGENFRSLTENEVTRYMDRFKEIEDISQDEVESDMGITFYSM